jgi:HAD superfamily hydrolase (TIGR01509 family)
LKRHNHDYLRNIRMTGVFSFSNVKAIIFDLDDTLVKTTLDFAKLKVEIGCTKDDDILSFIDNIECPTQQSNANQVVLAHELDDAHTSIWLPGALAFVEQAKATGMPLAIVTRNCQQATKIKMANNNIPIDIVLTRDDAPAKPDPTGLLFIAQRWQIAPCDIAYIGDYIYDIQAAHNANMQAWLYKQDKHENLHEYGHNLTYIAAE